jgi:hypothetical protein
MDFIVFSFLLLIPYLGVTRAIISHLPTVRNGAAFLVAALSAYTFSIALDTVWASVFGLQPPNLVLIAAGDSAVSGFIGRRANSQPNPMRPVLFIW